MYVILEEYGCCEYHRNQKYQFVSSSISATEFSAAWNIFVKGPIVYLFHQEVYNTVI